MWALGEFGGEVMRFMGAGDRIRLGELPNNLRGGGDLAAFLFAGGGGER